MGLQSISSLKLVEISGIEPLTSCLQGRRSPSWAKPPDLHLQFFWKWWAKMDSNHRPHDYQSCALASWAIGPYRRHKLRIPRFGLFSPKLAHSAASPLRTKPASLGFASVPYWFFHILRYFFPVPSKLNNVKTLTLCTDLRTLQLRSSS